MNNNDLKLSTCPVCGKKYIRPPQSVYKIYNGKNNVGVCSWGCVRKHEKRKEVKKK